MTVSQGTSRSQSPEPPWHEALAEFRERAQRLFEAQRARAHSLESSVAEQLATLDVADPSALATSREELGESSREEQEELRTQLAQCRKLLNTRAGELKQLRNLVAEQASGAEGVDVKVLLEQLSEMKLERDELIGRLADAQRQIERTSAADAEHFEELQRRFEVAVQEIRELKTRNSELRQHAATVETAPRAAPAVASTEFDWEQQKLRLVQQLESDLVDSDPEDKQTRLSIESTIRITDQVIAEKDRQIVDLRTRLEQMTVSTCDDTSSSTMLDNDEQIREERERLSRLEDEWRSKLRQAEIDISVERAKLARERSELDAKLRSVEESRSELAPEKAASSKQTGRWLSRLGLKDDD